MTEREWRNEVDEVSNYYGTVFDTVFNYWLAGSSAEERRLIYHLRSILVDPANSTEPFDLSELSQETLGRLFLPAYWKTSKILWKLERLGSWARLSKLLDIVHNDEIFNK